VVMDPRDSVSDEDLLRRFNQGDDSAFEVLVRRFERPLYNFILRSTRDAEQASELLQEVFLRVVQRSGEFQGQSKVGTWLYTMPRNLCIDTSRKMAFGRHLSLDPPSPGGDEGDAPALLDRIASPVAGSDRAVIGQDLQARIQVAVEALPEEQR